MLPKICSSPDLSQHTPFAAKTLNLRLFYRGFLHYPGTQLQWGARDTLECLIQAIHGHLVSIVAQIRDITQCVESANETLMIQNEGRRLRKLIQLLENEMN